MLDTVTNLLWHYKTASNGWIQAGGSTFDTTTLNLVPRFALKLNIADTTSMLTNYYRSGRAIGGSVAIGVTAITPTPTITPTEPPTITPSETPTMTPSETITPTPTETPTPTITPSSSPIPEEPEPLIEI